MKTFALATGSSGNCIYVEFENFRALIDCGFSFSRTKEILEEKGIDIYSITHIFITHEHTDHIQGLAMFVKNLMCEIYMSQGTLNGLDFEVKNLNIVKNYDVLNFNNIRVLVVDKPHDANEAISFIFEATGKKLGIFTDLGHVTDQMLALMSTLDLIYLECNYSVEYIRNNCSDMSHHYLNRLMSNIGHLGLHQTIEAIENFAKSDQIIILSHISENTLSYEEAISSVYNKIIELGLDLELEVSFQGEATDIFDLSFNKLYEERLLVNLN